MTLTHQETDDQQTLRERIGEPQDVSVEASQAEVQ